MTKPITDNANDSAATNVILASKKIDWRTKEARAARAAQRAKSMPTPTPAKQLIDNVPYVSPETQTAANLVDVVQAKCASVRRKLAAGSAAVTTEDLDRLERELQGARLRLGELSPNHPQALLHALQ